jgi:eukaryotic-like serine/threonine-protein kinase
MTVGELAIDELIDGKYKVQRRIGQGSWATVYEAKNVRIHRRVAIKVLNAELCEREDLVARFQREAEAATQITSAYVVTMFDAGVLESGQPYIVMEYLEGENLTTRLERLGPMSAEDAAYYAIDTLSGLADAHAYGVLHRDIKPENLVLVKSKTGEEIVKLVDFGISKPSSVARESGADLNMTRTDQVLGSPVYMAPEQARGTRHMDQRSDLYSVGVVLYELVTKELPHDADNFNELMFKIALEDVPDPRLKNPSLDPTFAAIIMKALAREPSARYQSAAEFRDALNDWLEDSNVAPRRALFSTARFRVRTPSSEKLPVLEDSSSKLVPAISSAPALVDTAAPVSRDAQPKPRRRGAIVAAAVVAVIAGIAFYAVRSRKSEPTVATIPAPTVSASAAREPEPKAAAAQTATAPQPTASTTAEVTPSAKPLPA